MNTTSKLLMATVLLLSGSVLWAQNPFRDAGAKVRGDAYWPSKAVGRGVQHARNYAQDFQTYVAKNEKPEPSVVNDIKAQLGRYLEDSRKHLATMKKDFAEDKETLAEIKKIEDELATAITANQAMIACCEHEKFDKVATMSCCTDLVKQLDKIHATHQSLMHRLTSKK
ncbi:MAG: hypothetical protein SFU86_12095 [Pirellulaceae bacterium]|nr:hypothetical protein [Pirellulaceae bacterium]